MRDRIAGLLARLARCVGGGPAGPTPAGVVPAVEPQSFEVGVLSCGCGDPGCRMRPRVVLTPSVGGLRAAYLLHPETAERVGRALVRQAALIQEHHVGDPE